MMREPFNLLTQKTEFCESKNNVSPLRGNQNPRRVDDKDPGYHYPINACLLPPITSFFFLPAKSVVRKVVQKIFIAVNKVWSPGPRILEIFH